ncbi:glycosyltransferase [Martelella radicis]|uniref:Glycosyltransferase involved in cell wall biosynthesis n=1 Tax=Martelella radicis TaxID=1397476 RepID=A0A7W6KK25_9HYPH|nr:glycosyltransferase involved in cell wall biosynthesis [Martelella radicis]
MKIIHLIASVDPAGGGPIEYARVMAEQHRKWGHESVFVTLDLPDAQWVSSFAFKVRACGPKNRFGAPVPAFSQAVLEEAANADAAVVHGLWHSASVSGYPALTRAKLPWVVFPHGMLDRYFRKAKPVTHLAKQLYWTAWQGRMFTDARAVLFTCAEEQKLAASAFRGHQDYRAQVVAFCAEDQLIGQQEIEDGRTAFKAALPALEGRDYLLFLSRIHPKKACDQLIEAFARTAGIDEKLDLVIAGPDQVGWQQDLQELAERLNIADRIHWPGSLAGAVKAAAFKDARAFVLPSHQENFGIVVAEALSAGTPVLISTQVNIWREIMDAGAGLCATDTVDATEDMLRRFLSLPDEAARRLYESARLCYEANFSVHQAATDLLNILDFKK